MRVLYLDCISGLSGDMTVGALCDLGVTPSTFEWELGKLEIGDFHMHFERQQRHHIEGVKFSIHTGATHTHDQDDPQEHEHEGGEGHHHPEHPHDHEHPHADEDAHEHGDECGCGHDHHDHEHAHGEEGHHHHHEDEPGHDHEHEHEHAHEAAGRNHAQIRALIESSELSDFVKQHALSIFQRIADAEGKIHGVPAADVAFHEVGALDSIADIICACVGLEQLGVDRIVASPLFEGRGWIDCAHGKMPIPSPATLEILKGIPLRQVDEPFEFITPTGAAILAEFASEFVPMPALRVSKIGYGIGMRKLESRPNLVRAVLGDAEENAGAYETDTVTQIETNLDDLSPELIAAAANRLLAAGALDVTITPTQMKKGRPGVLLSVLAKRDEVEALCAVIFEETSAFGVRLHEMRRLKLSREVHEVATPFGNVQVKFGRQGQKLLQAAPEFESVRIVAERTKRPVREIFEAAVVAARL